MRNFASQRLTDRESPVSVVNSFQSRAKASIEQKKDANEAQIVMRVASLLCSLSLA